METLINLLAVVYILVAPFVLTRYALKRVWPILLALVYALTAIISSALIYTPGIGQGGWLMVTVPFSPILLLYGWLVARLTAWWSARKVGTVSVAKSSPTGG